MSDDEQTPTPDDSAHKPEDAAPVPSGEGDAGGAGGPDGQNGVDPTEAVEAAQRAVSDALDADVAGASAEDERRVGEAKQVAEESRAEASEAAGVSTDANAARSAAERGETPTPFVAPSFDPAPPSGEDAEIQLLADVNVDVRIELGRTRMLVEDVLRLGEGAVVELEKLAGDPVDVYVNGRHVARGEVLVLNENFCVRVNEVLEPMPVNRTG